MEARSLWIFLARSLCVRDRWRQAWKTSAYSKSWSSCCRARYQYGQRGLFLENQLEESLVAHRFLCDVVRETGLTEMEIPKKWFASKKISPTASKKAKKEKEEDGFWKENERQAVALLANKLPREFEELNAYIRELNMECSLEGTCYSTEELWPHCTIGWKFEYQYEVPAWHFYLSWSGNRAYFDGKTLGNFSGGFSRHHEGDLDVEPYQMLSKYRRNWPNFSFLPRTHLIYS